MKGEARDLYETIRQDLIRLNANWLMFRQLFTASDERFVVYNATAPAFFRLLQDLLVDNAVISLSRLTDPDHYQSFSRLIRALKGQVKHSFFLELRADLAALEAECADIREHRHRRVAHKPLRAFEPTVPDLPKRLPPLNRKKIEGAMASMAALMNKVLGYFEDAEQFYEPVIRGDANTLYYFLEKGYEGGQQEREKLAPAGSRPKSA